MSDINKQVDQPIGMMESLAKQAYDAYGDDAEWKTWDGRPMPTWDDLTTAVRDHWKAAIHSVCSTIKPDYLLAQAESAWITDFDNRQQAEIRFSQEYYKNFQHGTDGHNAKVIIAKMVTLLDKNNAKAIGYEDRT